MSSHASHLLEIVMWTSVAVLVLPGLVTGMISFYRDQHHHV